eukprot:436598-Rhodomonas_salina.1
MVSLLPHRPLLVPHAAVPCGALTVGACAGSMAQVASRYHFSDLWPCDAHQVRSSLSPVLAYR